MSNIGKVIPELFRSLFSPPATVDFPKSAVPVPRLPGKPVLIQEKYPVADFASGLPGRGDRDDRCGVKRPKPSFIMPAVPSRQCAETCPFDAIEITAEHHLAAYSKEALCQDPQYEGPAEQGRVQPEQPAG